MKKNYTDAEGVLGKKLVTHALKMWLPIPKLKKYYYMSRKVKFETLCKPGRFFEGDENYLNVGHEVDCPNCCSSWDGIETEIEKQFK